jgi:hypothetical protein
MLDERFVILGALAAMAGTGSYVWATLTGRAQPNRVTWGCWSAAPLIAFAAELQEGVGLRSLMTFVVGLGPLLIFIASFVNPQAYWKLGPFDLACGTLSIVALVGWAVTRSGVVAILLAILADLVAGVPTIIKTWRAPETEAPLLFALSIVNAGIALLTVDHWTTANVAFPILIACTGTTLTVIAYSRRGRASTDLRGVVVEIDGRGERRVVGDLDH